MTGKTPSAPWWHERHGAKVSFALLMISLMSACVDHAWAQRAPSRDAGSAERAPRDAARGDGGSGVAARPSRASVRRRVIPAQRDFRLLGAMHGGAAALVRSMHPAADDDPSGSDSSRPPHGPRGTGGSGVGVADVGVGTLGLGRLARPGERGTAPSPRTSEIAATSPTPRGTVRLLSSTVSGALADETVRRASASGETALRNCYAAQLALRPALAGQVTVRYVVSAAGEVTGATPERMSTGLDALAGCVATVVRQFAFPVRREGQAVVTSEYAFTP